MQTEKAQSFQNFRLKYGKHLIKFKFHWFKYLTLGKAFTTDVRRQYLQQGEVSIHHDFTEALHVKHNEEIQSKHFGGGVTVIIEGYTVNYNFMDGSSLVFDFHSFLSDDKTQMANTVHRHMDQLISKLMKKHILVPGGRLLSGTDGCAKQYRCSNAVYFISVLATKYNIVVDRSISCSGHGKNEVNAINGVDKNTIYRRSMRKHVHAADALQSANKCMLAHSFSPVAGDDSYSAAEDCKRVLENDGSEGVKSEGKRTKRESERGINNRYWHVRKVEDKLSNIRCETIKNFSKTCTFMDMYHYYTCPELKIGFAEHSSHKCLH